MENKIEKSGSSKGKMIIIFILILAVMGLGAYIGYSKFLSNSNNTNSSQNQNNVQTQTQNQLKTVNSSELSQIVSSKTFQLSSTDGLTVNLADAGGNRYLKVSVFLGYNDKKLTAELTEKQPIITDAVIGVLRNKKSSDMIPKNMDNIKMEIIQKINPMLQKGQINNVYFTDLIVQ